MIPWLKKNHVTILLTCFFVVGAGIRFIGVGSGLPYVEMEDEHFFVDPALRIASGGWNPGWFGAPGQPVIYITGFVFRVVNAVINWHNGTSLAAFQNYAADMVPFQIAGRVWIALVGATLPLLAFWVLHKYSRTTAWIAMVFVGTNFYLLHYSHIIRPDILQTTLLFLTLGFFIRGLLQPENNRLWIYAGIFFGASITTKYPSLFITPTLVYGAWYLWRQHALRAQAIMRFVVATISSCIVTAPFMLLDWHTAAVNFRTEQRTTHLGHDGLGFFGNMWWYFTEVLPWQVGTGLLALVCIGLVMRIVVYIRHRRVSNMHYRVLVISAVSYFILTSYLALHWERWLIPVSALALMLAAMDLHSAYLWLRTKLPQHRAVAVCAFATAILLLAPITRLYKTVDAYSAPDTATQAAAWMQANIPEDATIAYESHAPRPIGKNWKVISKDIGQLPIYRWRGAQGATHLVFTDSIFGRLEAGEQANTLNEGQRRSLEYYRGIVSEGRIVYQTPNNGRGYDDAVFAPDWSVLINGLYWRIGHPVTIVEL